uniref:XK-related protein n=1 Tax=Heterorhabditis bacteriophora TaxID=37862 RepID=A0A1I7WQH8_HETBA
MANYKEGLSCKAARKLIKMAFMSVELCCFLCNPIAHGIIFAYESSHVDYRHDIYILVTGVFLFCYVEEYRSAGN